MIDRSPTLEPVSLADEPDFDLGGLTVRPSRGTVQAGDDVVRLEPRVMQVLVVLAANEDEVVSRDLLIARCWNGRIVGEDAINRVLGRLRGLARETGERFVIETVARIGYILKVTGNGDGQVDQSLPEAEASSPPASRPWRGTFRGWALIILIGFVVAAGVAGLIWQVQAHRALVLGQYEVLVGGPLEERSPDLSHDGRFIAFTQSSTEGPSEVWTRAVSGGEAVRLVGPEAGGAVSPAWSPRGDAVAFVRVGVGDAQRREPCRIYVKPFPAGTERLIGRCGFAPWTGRLSWTPDGEAIVYSEWLNPSTFGSRIRRISVRDGTIVDLTQPPQGNGDVNPAVSPDGRRIAFIRNDTRRGGDVHVLDIASGQVEKRTEGSRASWVEWTDDGRTLLVTSSDGGPSELWGYDLDSRTAPQRLLVGLQDVQKVSAAADRIAFETRFISQAIVRRSGTSEATIASGAVYPTVDVAPDGVVGFVALSPRPTLWLQRPGSAAGQLLELPFSDPRFLTFSPSGQRVSLTGEDGPDSDLFVIDRDSGVVSRLPSPGVEVSRGSWAANGLDLIRSGFDGRDGGIYRLPRLSEADRVRIVGPGWPFAESSPDGIFAVRIQSQGIWRIRPGESPVQVTSTGSAGLPWRVSRGAIYVLVGQPGDRARLMRYPLDGATPSMVADGAIADFAVDPRNGDLILVQTLQSRQDIGMLPLSRR